MKMKEQKLILKDMDCFELDHIFDCGQCFRWNKQEDGSYIGVISSGVLRVSKNKNTVSFEGMLDGDINSIVYDYFDLETDYASLKRELGVIDDNMKKSIKFGFGIRILNQDLWETIISFIISANNNIPRIKGIIDRISKKVGKRIEWDGKEYYLFPTIEEMATLSVSDLRELGTGFRDKRIYKTTQMILEKQVDLNELESLNDTNEIREELLKLDGVGEKVADCIMLFALKRFDSFPIDVWVRRVMNTLYIHNEDETKVNKKDIKLAADNLFGDKAGIAQQYLFYWARENF
ncbi:MAG: 8-oxoguanine DNA glycosylase [Clostridia bacterium]|jgi:N-glycosylase/DNA lyase|nr:8-oxoguanine DNA glycosylase [Clostridia bacterium]